MATTKRVLSASLVALLAGCGGPRTLDPELREPAPAAYARLAGEVREHLLDNVLPAWFPRAVDREGGGFYANFARDWSRLPGNPKSIVYQARLTWVAATVAVEYPHLADEYRAYARHGAACLRQHLWDAEHGGFLWRLDEPGRQPDRRDREKHLYGNAFGIYALAKAHEATGDESARALAAEAFGWLEAHCHDAAHGGYRDAVARDGKPLDAAGLPVEQRTDAIGTLYGCKSMNAHIHALEALTELYRVSPDAALRARLAELLGIVRDRIAVEPGCLNLYFTPDWRPLPYHDSFGHDVETAFLLLEAAEALGKEADPKTLAVARGLVDHALDYGWDDEYGGFYDEGTATSSGQNLQKVWWVQAEGLNVLLLMHERFGAATRRYYDAFLKQWLFIDNHLVDHACGGWYPQASREGRPTSRQKASVWKAPYHTVRALIGAEKRLRRLAKSP